MRIYRHAIESILGMLTLADLAQILSVSREWSAAVRSMAPINAALESNEHESLRAGKVFRPLPPIESIGVSPLLRHVSVIHIFHTPGGFTPFTGGVLAFLAHHAPNLQSLWVRLTLTPNEPLVLPAKLTSLLLRLNDEYTDATINRVLKALAGLPSLSQLCLSLSAFSVDNSIQLSILAASRSLTDLTLETCFGSTLSLTLAQEDQIRLYLGQLQRINVGWFNSDKLARLLQPPVRAQLRDIGPVWVDARSPELLLQLPPLTSLDLSFTSNADVDFLAQLPLLSVLNLSCYKRTPAHVGVVQREWLIPADALLASLVRCVCITELNVSCGFSTAHWTALFAKLTLLKKLTIRFGRLETLRHFAEGPITQSLEALTLAELDLPPSEASHLFGLRRLRTLQLVYCFSSRLDDTTIDELSPPTPLLPALTDLFNLWKITPRKCDHVRCQGPSFESIQQS